MDTAVVVALGSNLGWEDLSPGNIVAAAVERFSDIGLKLVRRSSLWRSPAWPDPADPDYINAVALVETSLPPDELLTGLHRLETAFARVRGAANAPRTLDLDLIAYGRRVSDIAPLLPHPRAWERLFVMGPLAEIAPAWRDPLDGRTARELAAGAKVGRGAFPIADQGG